MKPSAHRRSAVATSPASSFLPQVTPETIGEELGADKEDELAGGGEVGDDELRRFLEHLEGLLQIDDANTVVVVGKTAQIEEQGHQLVDSRSNALDGAISTEKTARMRRVLEQLSARDRILLRGVFLEDRDKDEICREFGVDRTYLRVLIHRAKESFRQQYTRHIEEVAVVGKAPRLASDQVSNDRQYASEQPAKAQYRDYQLLVERTIDVFGDPTKASLWLSQPSPDFGGKVPLQVAQSVHYAAAELEELFEPIFIRIEHGIYW